MATFKQKLFVVAMSMGLVSLSHAELRVNGEHVEASSLQQARSIMYGDGYRFNDNNQPVEHANNPYATSTNNYEPGYSTAEYNAYNPVQKLDISTGSRGVMVMDLETKQPLYEKNADIARPIASITKLMTAMVILDAGLDMNEEIQIASSDFKYAGGKTSGYDYLKVGDRLSRDDMLQIMLMKSENPAGKALARTYPGGYDAFIRDMNRKAESLGMYSANFGDPIGMDKNNVASPSDLVKMVQGAGRYDTIRHDSTSGYHDFYVANYNRGNRTVSAKNTSYLVRDRLYPIGISKTGFINEAGKCVVMETRINNRPAVVVILGAGSSKTRWGDAENILKTLSSRRYI